VSATAPSHPKAFGEPSDANADRAISPMIYRSSVRPPTFHPTLEDDVANYRRIILLIRTPP